MALRIVASRPDPAIVTPALGGPARGVGRRATSCRCRAGSRATWCGSCGCGERIYAVKETVEDIAFREYRLLRDLQRLGLPAVVPQGVVTGRVDADGEELPARC